MVFCYDLKLAIGCSGSVASWKALLCRPSLAAACNWSETTCYEVQSDPKLFAACAGPGGVWESPRYESRLAFTSTKPGETQSPRAPQGLDHLLATHKTAAERALGGSQLGEMGPNESPIW